MVATEDLINLCHLRFPDGKVRELKGHLPTVYPGQFFRVDHHDYAVLRIAWSVMDGFALQNIYLTR